MSPERVADAFVAGNKGDEWLALSTAEEAAHLAGQLARQAIESVAYGTNRPCVTLCGGCKRLRDGAL